MRNTILAMLVPIVTWPLLAHAEERPEVAAPGSSGAAVFWAFGAPGPWTREGATREDFDRESRGCLDRSQEARDLAPPDDRSARAYEAFVDCMAEWRWTRGTQPAAADTDTDEGHG